MNAENAMAGERAKLLARVALTRRLNVSVHPFEDKDDVGIDLICTVQDDDVKGFLPFGVMVWGTPRALAHGGDVSAMARQRLKGHVTTFFLPVIILAFSMHDDAGFFSWLVEPDPEGRKLILHTKPVFRPFTTRHLDLVVEAVVDWYRRIGSVLIEVEAGSGKGIP
jgi:hypothetical protein